MQNPVTLADGRVKYLRANAEWYAQAKMYLVRFPDDQSACALDRNGVRDQVHDWMQRTNTRICPIHWS